MTLPKELYRLLAGLLRYPDRDTLARAERCQSLLGPLQPEAADLLEQFVAFAGARSVEDLEEIYTATFDLNPRCYPYAGCQLLGDDPRRGMLLAKLKECYRSHGFDLRGELPDHVPALLEFVAGVEDGETERDFREDLVGPALQRMAGSFAGSENGYAKVIQAAAVAVTGTPDRATERTRTPGVVGRETDSVSETESVW